jgi:hypothetical protein
MLSQKRCVILLTGTIIPNTGLKGIAHKNSVVRRQEYLDAVRFYVQFGEVLFLENSIFDFDRDPEFMSIEGLKIIKCPSKLDASSGLGSQEFRMIDYWLENFDMLPDRWVKVTGRYIFNNFSDLYSHANQTQGKMIFERKMFSGGKLRTDIFSVTTDFYKKYLLGCYLDMNDAEGKWAEHVFFDRLKVKKSIIVFRKYPILIGISGSTGIPFKYTIKNKAVNMIRNSLYKFFRLYRFF